MALTIKQPEVEELARELAKRTGETVDVAVAIALRERIDRSRQISSSESEPRSENTLIRDPMVEAVVERMRHEPLPDPDKLHMAIREIQESLAKLPVLDSRTPDEILGYDEFGLPH